MGFYIGEKRIGDDSATYIIAEIGINHNGNEQTAYELIDAAIAAGVDAVKFQKRHLPSIYLPDVLDHPEHYEQNFQYMIPLLKSVELSDNSFVRIKKYCDEKRITFLCTPFDSKSLDSLVKLNVQAFKVSSADLTNKELVENIANTGLPLILSTGMSTWQEITRVVSLLRKKRTSFALLHCRSVYPVWPREVNLRMITQLKEFGVPVGYSGHELGITVSLVAASMGACIIEKHISLDRTQSGPDHKVSLEPEELKRLVRDIRVADQAIGKEKRLMLRGEVLNRELFAKSLIATEDILSGTIIKKEMVEVKGPGKGLAPDKIDLLIGKKINRHIDAGTFFYDEDLEEGSRSDFKSAFTGNWGLIARFTDFEKMHKYCPKTLEFHLAERDFDLGFKPTKQYPYKLIVHAPEYIGDNLLDLCSASEDIRKKSVELILKTIRLANNIAGKFVGIPKIIAHPGAMSLKDKLLKELLSERLQQSLSELRQYQETSNIELLFENLPPYPWYFGGQWKGNYFMDASEIIDFCKINDMKICYDLSHMALYCNAKGLDLKEATVSLLPYSSHLHLADGYGLDGEGVQFGDGDIDLESVMPVFNGFKGTWVPEVWRGHLNDGRGFLKALEYLKRYLL